MQIQLQSVQEFRRAGHTERWYHISGLGLEFCHISWGLKDRLHREKMLNPKWREWCFLDVVLCGVEYEIVYFSQVYWGCLCQKWLLYLSQWSIRRNSCLDYILMQSKKYENIICISRIYSLLRSRQVAVTLALFKGLYLLASAIIFTSSLPQGRCLKILWKLTIPERVNWMKNKRGCVTPFYWRSFCKILSNRNKKEESANKAVIQGDVLKVLRYNHPWCEHCK